MSIQPLVALRALKRLIADKEDTSQVFEVVRALTGKATQRGYRRFRNTPTGRRVLAEERELLSVLADRDQLAAMPAGSLGALYLDYLTRENISAEGLVDASESAPIRDEDPGVARYARRLRDQHDLWHVLTGYGRDGFGEVCLLGFTFAQTRNPGILAIALMGAHKNSQAFPGERIWGAVWRAFQDGRRAAWLPGQDWEALLSRPVDALRYELNIARPYRYEQAENVILATGPDAPSLG